MDNQTHRKAQLTLRAATIRDLGRLFPMLDLERIAATWPAFEKAALLLIRQRGRVSAGIAHAFYAAARRSAGIPGSAPPMQATPTDDEILAGLRVMGPVNTAKQLALGRLVADVRQTTLVNLAGVASKYVLDHGRDTLLNAVHDDPRARGWLRETSGVPCDFCGMLASRGAVYKTEQTAGFASHRSCACTPAPVW